MRRSASADPTENRVVSTDCRISCLSASGSTARVPDGVGLAGGAFQGWDGKHMYRLVPCSAELRGRCAGSSAACLRVCGFAAVMCERAVRRPPANGATRSGSPWSPHCCGPIMIHRTHPGGVV
ncbi:hypothetical protein Acsp04_52050 [Actinomadura sp. NBRC 104425]|nr:hypothetical protein Acsp04_52050 [Actinomadura sp. NBRC 104425]